MVQPIGRNEVQELAEHVKNRDLDKLKGVVPETLLNLDQTLNYRFVVDSTFLQILTEIRDGLNLQTRISELNTKLNDPTLDTFGIPKGFNDQITQYENKINTLNGEISVLEGQKVPHMNIITDMTSTKDQKNAAKTAISTIEGEIQTRKNKITTYQNNIQTAQGKKNQIDQEKKNLEGFRNTYKTIIGISDTRGTRKRLTDLIKIGKLYNINNLIPRQNYRIGEPVALTTMQLNPIFVPGLGTNPINYVICNNQTGEPIPNGGGTLEITTDSGQTIKLKGVKIKGNVAEFEDIQIEPMTDIGFPLNLRLAIRGRIQDPVTGMNMDHFKNLDLTINQPNFDRTARQNEINSYNNSGGGQIIEQAMKANHDVLIAKLEREAFFRGLEKADGPKFNKLTAEQKENLYQEVRNMYRASTLPRTTNLANMNNFSTGTNSFIEWFSGEKHESNKHEFTKNATAYRDFIHNNLEEQIKKYFEWRFDEVFSKNTDGNTYLKAELSRFLTDIEKRKNDNEQVGGQYIHQAIEGNITDKDIMKKYKRKKFLGISRGRPDVSYMRFYNGASHEIKDQKVDIYTNTKVEDLNNPEPVKYDLKTDILGKNNISVTIKFPDNDKRYPRKEITLKQGEVSTLAKKILNCPEIRDFKVKTHIVYNMLVSMIEISKKKDLSLRYRDPTTGHQREIIKTDKNITLYDWDDAGGIRAEKILFDYDAFVATNTFHGTGDNRSLQTAIDELMGHFNYAMNTYHEQYRKATKSNLLKTNISANNFWTSPLKTIMNLKTTRKFDFTTTAKSDDGKQNVEIEFKNNTIRLKMGDIELKGKDLGKILEYRKNKVRVFDGVERNIIFAFYDEIIKKLRENSKINRSNFAVRDDLTKNIYVMDEDGQLGIVTPEDPGDILGNKTHGIIHKKELDAVDVRGGRRICTAEETKEAFMNPCIMGRMIKAMNTRMKRL